MKTNVALTHMINGGRITASSLVPGVVRLCVMLFQESNNTRLTLQT